MKKFLIYLLPLFIVACAKPDPICTNKDMVAQVNSVQFNLEVACKDEDKKTGLMNRKSLAQDSGMIFVYDHEDYYAFWMKNTYIPLSIAFLDKNKKIVDIRNMQPHDLTPVATSVKAIYAIEMNLNWFTSNNIKIGDTLKIIN
jgi:uncharacterized protein